MPPPRRCRQPRSPPRCRRSCRSAGGWSGTTAAGRAVLDDTAAHPDSFRATFEVADMLADARSASDGRCRVVVAYAIRGNRGADINRRNAEALADLIGVRRIDSIVVTAALDVAGETDRATTAEIDATRDAFVQPRHRRRVARHASCGDARRRRAPAPGRSRRAHRRAGDERGEAAAARGGLTAAADNFQEIQLPTPNLSGGENRRDFHPAGTNHSLWELEVGSVGS